MCVECGRTWKACELNISHGLINELDVFIRTKHSTWFDLRVFKEFLDEMSGDGGGGAWIWKHGNAQDRRREGRLQLSKTFAPEVIVYTQCWGEER